MSNLRDKQIRNLISDVVYEHRNDDRLIFNVSSGGKMSSHSYNHERW